MINPDHIAETEQVLPISCQLEHNIPEVDLASQSTATQALTHAGHPRRNYRVPARFVDTPPEPLAPANADEMPASNVIPRVLLIVHNRLVTAANYFGLYRDYHWRPTYDPSGQLALKDLTNAHTLEWYLPLISYHRAKMVILKSLLPRVE